MENDLFIQFFIIHWNKISVNVKYYYWRKNFIINNVIVMVNEFEKEKQLVCF